MFNHDAPPPVVKKRMSFLSVALLCGTSIVITTILTAGGLAGYGLRFVDHKTETLPALIAQVAEKLPQIYDALPPALVDAMDDERRPEYRDQLRVSVRLGEVSDPWGGRRAIVEVENKGEDTVNLLSMRIVSLDKRGEPLDEQCTWAATPLQMDDSWRGPLLPRSRRQFSVRCRDAEDAASVSHEITEIRVWRGCEEDAEEDDEASVRARRVALNAPR